MISAVVLPIPAPAADIHVSPTGGQIEFGLYVLHTIGTIFIDGFESGDTSAWQGW